jgi:DNA polymerase III delta prime subunit
MDMAMKGAATIEEREDLQAVSDAVKAKVFELDEITREKKEDLDQAYRDAIVGIDKGKIRAALDDLQTTLTQLQEASNFGKPVSEEDERTNNFYNILAEPQGPAADKRLEMLQAIEEYEDLPSAQSRVRGPAVGPVD